MLSFIAAVYNEEQEASDLFNHVFNLVDDYYICDDGSTDKTLDILKAWAENLPGTFHYKTIEHTGLPETVKNEAKEMVPDASWILMLDADERLDQHVFAEIKDFFNSGESENWDFVYFNQFEMIDGIHVRTFQKAKLFRKQAIAFPLHNIHADDQFIGDGTYFAEWIVYHRKTSTKQKQRELEYLHTYDKLLKEGSIDEGRRSWLRSLHHYFK